MDETTIWYYIRDGRQVGPIGTDQLRMAVAQGDLRPADVIWHKGLTDWVAAGTLPGLFPSATVAEYRPKVNPFEPLHIPGGDLAGFESGSEFFGYAGILKRFAAALVDQLLLYVPSFAVSVAVLSFQRPGNDGELDSLVPLLIINVSNITMAWLYGALMESSRLQGTLGKLVLGIRVCDEHGRRVSFGRATGRHFGKFLSSVMLGIGFIMAAFTQRKQALHDIMAGCLVVNRW